MTIRDLIAQLLECDCTIDDKIQIYVSAKTKAIKEYIDDSEVWCLDNILSIDEVDDRGGYVLLIAEEIK